MFDLLPFGVLLGLHDDDLRQRPDDEQPRSDQDLKHRIEYEDVQKIGGADRGCHKDQCPVCKYYQRSGPQ